MRMHEMKCTDAENAIMSPRITFALNLCDVALAKADVAELVASAERHISPTGGTRPPAVSRIYLGSYYCERSFLAITDEEAHELGAFCNKHGIGITLVMPSPLESMRDATYRKAERLARALDDAFDELCVNDIGTLSRALETRKSLSNVQSIPQNENLSALDSPSIETDEQIESITLKSAPSRQRTPETSVSSGFNIVAGRLFFKQQRDPRTPEAFMPASMSAASLDLEQEIGALSCIETDLAFTQLHVDESIPANCTIALHYPFTLVSRMRVCQFAHDSRPASPFSAATPCRLECRREIMEYRTHEGARFYKAGKSIVAPADASLRDAMRALPSDRPIRIVWQPSFEEVAR